MSISDFMTRHYRHFNAAVTLDAAKAYVDFLDQGNRMFITLAGAMSTAELGISLAEMIRQGNIHAICATGANLEEDIFNLVAHSSYRRLSAYRTLKAEEEAELRDSGLNRVTDTCIPEEEAIRKVERRMVGLWQRADKEDKSYFPYEYVYQLMEDEDFEQEFEIDPRNSWVLAAAEKNIPILTPGWEDSTLGNVYVSHVMAGDLSGYTVVKPGLEQMAFLVDWYLKNDAETRVGFFQIGGGIAGDFPICVVPLIHQDLGRRCRYWGYFCQISDSTTSYGSYSGAVPNEKISWGKLDVDTPRFVIESDASIVAPLIFSYVLGM